MSLVSNAVVLVFVGFFFGIFLWQLVINLVFLAVGLYDTASTRSAPAPEIIVQVAKRAGAAWFALFGGAAAFLALATTRNSMIACLLAGAALVPAALIPNAIDAAYRKTADFPLRRFLRKVAQSFVGTLLLFQVILGIPMFAVSIIGHYMDGQLTVAMVLLDIIVSCVTSGVVGVFMYMILGGIRPLPTAPKDSSSHSPKS